MIIATTPNIEGREILDVLGLVIGNSVEFASALQKPMTLQMVEQATSSAMEVAESRMVEKARKLGAHAIAGASVSITAFAHGQAAVASCSQGTAVVLKDLK